MRFRMEVEQRLEQKYDGYFITSCGRVWSYHSNRFLTLTPDKDGYLRVCLGENYRLKGIHRLVAETYLDNPENYDTVDHIDFNKENNCVNNLRWLSRSENSKRKQRKVRCIETGETYSSISEAARHYGKSRECLSNHINGKQNTWLGRHWEVIDNV